MAVAAVVAFSISPLSASPGSDAAVSERAEPRLGESVTARLVDAARVASMPKRPRSETCRSARIGLAWYRGRQRDWLKLRGVTQTPAGRRAPRSCPDARWLAQVAKRRSFAARRATERWVERRRNRVPVGESELRSYINDDCLAEIIDRESAGTWSPTVRNYTDGIAYGLPQARPGYKMASAGADWETNPKTQIAWMRGYVNGRYGGSCAALAHHNANGWY